MCSLAISNGHHAWVCSLIISNGHHAWVCFLTISNGYHVWVCSLTISNGYHVWVYFLAISNAYAILSDKTKREQYDQYGEEGINPSRRVSHQYSRGFEADISPEDLFRVFFGGGNCKG